MITDIQADFIDRVNAAFDGIQPRPYITLRLLCTRGERRVFAELNNAMGSQTEPRITVRDFSAEAADALARRLLTILGSRISTKQQQVIASRKLRTVGGGVNLQGQGKLGADKEDAA